MVSITLLGVKGLAVASAGLFSLASGAPISTSATNTTETVTDSTNVATTSTPALTTGGEAAAISSAQSSNVPSWDMTDYKNHLLLSLSQIPDSKAPDNDEESREFQLAADLFGITTAQMAKVQLETTDSELAEPADDMTPDETISELANNKVLDRLALEARDESEPAIVLEETLDERKNKLFMKQRQDMAGFYVGLVNGTPYRWKRIGKKFKDVDSALLSKLFREDIQPGEPLTVYVRTWSQKAEALIKYELVGTSEKTWFKLRISPGRPHQVTVEYGGALETVAAGDEGKRGSIVDLGVDRGVSCATFYLTGSEGRFLSNDAPANWMHTMMEEIGNYTLRDVMLPRSHHAGMYTLDDSMGLGNRANTFTQDFSVYDQLKVGGVRVIDSRPVLKRKSNKVHESHGSKVAGLYHGTLGVSHDSMIDQINRFNDDYPGELIIIDVDGREMRGDKHFNQLDAAGVAHIVESFKRLKHRAVLVPGEDIARIPLSRFIGDGQSAVVIRMEEHRIRNLPGEGYPGATQGFVTSDELPYHKHWSNMKKLGRMVKDQIGRLSDYKDGSFRKLYASDFLLTQKGIDVLFGAPIREINEEVWRMLVGVFWPFFHKDVYPNWIAMDSIRGSELRGIAMAVNECLVAKRCGKLGDRVPDAEDFKFRQTFAAEDRTSIQNATTTQSADTTTTKSANATTTLSADSNN
ncbi:hypothetical protein MY11210_004948 [Beauveria gryllotalpidicola]